MKKFEFSKLIFVISYLLVLEVTLFSEILMWKTGNVGPLQYLIPAVFAQLATVVSFYMWKAKAENTLKIKKAAMQAHIDISDDIIGEKR